MSAKVETEGKKEEKQVGERLANGTASTTMMYQAVFRHCGYKDRQTDDYLARHFISSALLQCVIACVPSLGKATVEKKAPGLYAHSVCRSKAGDVQMLRYLNEFEKKPELGKPQILVCGGGFCTRFERYRELLEKLDATYIELDIDCSQAEKLRLCEKAKCFTNIPNGCDPSRPMMKSMQWLAWDANKIELTDLLLPATNPNSTFDPSLRTLVIWEGVAMYLDPKVVDGFFQFVVKNTAPGSLLQMDFFEKEGIDKAGIQDPPRYGGRGTIEQCIKKGEPLLSGISFEKEPSEAFLKTHGFVFYGGFGGEFHWPPARVNKEFFNYKKRSLESMMTCTLETRPDLVK